MLDADRAEALRREGHHAVDLYVANTTHVRANGVIVDRIAVVRHFLTDAGSREHGTLSLSARATARQRIDEAYVRLPDGRIVRQPRGSVRFLPRSERDLFSDAFEVMVPFEHLVAGASVVLVMTVESNTREWPLPWSRLTFVTGRLPIEHRHIGVSWDRAARPPELHDDVPELSCTRAPRRVTCTRTSIPHFVVEPDMIGLDDVPQFVAYESASWQQLASRVAALVDRAAVVTPRVEAEARRLTTGAGSRAEALHALHRFVAERIRYVGFEEGRGAVVPRSADMTLHTRYGDCKDKTSLLVALARAAGFEAHGVLVATNYFRSEKLIAPSWQYFDHMIAAVRGDDGDVLLDLTEPNTATGVLPVPLVGAMSLPARSDVTKPTPLQSTTPSWRITAETENRIRCDGALRETLARRFEGGGAAKIRQLLQAMPLDGRSRFVETSYRDVMGESLQPASAVQALDEVNQPLVLTTETTFPQRLALDGAPTYREADIWLIHFGQWFKTRNRTRRYRVPGAEIVSRVIYHLCPDRRPEHLGAELALHSEFGALVRRYDRDGERLYVETRLTLPRQWIEPEALESYNRFLSRVLDQSTIWFSFEQ